MKRMNRYGVAVAIVAAMLTGAAPAHATSCNIVSDASGDGYIAPTTVANHPDLDIVSADVASDSTYLTAVFRLSDVDPVSISKGTEYDLAFTLNGEQLQFTAQSQLKTTTYTLSMLGTEPGGVVGVYQKVADGTGVWDTVANEVRITVLVSDVTSHVALATGDVLDSFYAVSYRFAGVWAAADHAYGNTSYAAGDASCVTPGA